MKAVIVSLTLGVSLVLPITEAAFAGQPGTSAGVNCGLGMATVTPGNSAFSPGAPFNEPFPIGTGAGGKAGMVYAGSGPSATHARSPNAVSQYDIACFNVTNRVP
jgi:hypothetical protein